jgi:hypothetical protein
VGEGGHGPRLPYGVRRAPRPLLWPAGCARPRDDGERGPVRDAQEALDSGRVHRDRGKVGDLTGASGAYVLGLLGYEVGAAAMTVAQGLGAIIVSGGDRRDRRVAAAARDAVADPGNFDGAMWKKVLRARWCRRTRRACFGECHAPWPPPGIHDGDSVTDRVVGRGSRVKVR